MIGNLWLTCVIFNTLLLPENKKNLSNLAKGEKKALTLGMSVLNIPLHVSWQRLKKK
jgi:hypothetical protein